jgi:hypothetical protein
VLGVSCSNEMCVSLCGNEMCVSVFSHMVLCAGCDWFVRKKEEAQGASRISKSLRMY